MIDRLIFLDIDGVLNNAGFPPGATCRPMIDPANVEHLNRIVRETKAKVVISSTWRSMIHPEFMTLKGFEMMLLTHRIRCEVIGLTERSAAPRGAQITNWIALNRPPRSVQHVVLDDDDDEVSGVHPFVQTDGTVGLTEADADRAIDLLLSTGSTPP